MNPSSLSWPLAEKYPSCHTLDLFENFSIEDITPKQIFFVFYKMDKMSVTLLTEERNKVTLRWK